MVAAFIESVSHSSTAELMFDVVKFNTKWRSEVGCAEANLEARSVAHAADLMHSIVL
jgi:hypothetical protein